MKTYKDWIKSGLKLSGSKFFRTKGFLQVNDTVDNELANYVITCLPPFVSKDGSVIQMSEPIHIVNGRNTYFTLKRTITTNGEKFVYKGHCFKGQFTDKI